MRRCIPVIWILCSVVACGGEEGQSPHQPGGRDAGAGGRDAGTGAGGEGGDGGLGGSGGPGGAGGAGTAGGGAGAGGLAGMGGAGGAAGAPLLGTREHPIPITSFPFVDENNTAMSQERYLARYSCAEMTSEGGPEVYYVITAPGPGLLQARIDDMPGDMVDVDLHLLGSLDGGDCLARGDVTASTTLPAAGTYYLVADTWVDGSGMELPGHYRLEVTFSEMATGRCDVREEDILLRNRTEPLRLPATGPVVLEAHLVTDEETFPASGWPQSFTDGIERHYELSQARTGYVMTRGEPWAPAGEGGSMYGQGSSSKPPVDAEAWYVNMYWTTRPANGTRMIVTNPANGRSVVAAAGYETGPGANTAIGGVAEEVHHYLGTVHRSDLTLGFAVDQTLPFGPISCQ